MKKLSTRITAAFLTAVLVITLLPVSVFAAQENTPKEEVVYINLNADGSVKEINVVNIFDLDKDGQIIDYGKYKYEMIRREKEAKKKQKVIEVKEVRLSPNIDTNDLNTKVGSARKFIEKGNKVKVTLRFRGREMAHMNQTRYILDDFAEKLADIAVVDKPSKVEGRSLVMFLTAKK